MDGALLGGGVVSSSEDPEGRMDAFPLPPFSAPPALLPAPGWETAVLFSILFLLNETDRDLDRRIPGVGI